MMKNLPPLEECVVELYGVIVLVLLYCDFMYNGTRMNTYTYHYRMDGPH